MSFGFRTESHSVLAEAILEHGVTQEVTRVVESPHGVSYEVEGHIRTPDGRNPYLRTVWLVSGLDRVPRLVTAYPTRRRSDV